MRNLVLWAVVFVLGYLASNGCMRTIQGVAQDVGSICDYVDDNIVPDEQ